MTIANFEFILKGVRQTRHNMQRLMEGLSIEQLNSIPAGFNNNLVWNYGHVIATQQLLCYGLSDQALFVDQALIASYRKGTAPMEMLDESAVQNLQRSSTAALDQFEQDYVQGLFQTFKLYPTSFGVELTRIEEALQFNLAHETMHLGTMLSLKKLV